MKLSSEEEISVIKRNINGISEEETVNNNSKSDINTLGTSVSCWMDNEKDSTLDIQSHSFARPFEREQFEDPVQHTSVITSVGMDKLFLGVNDDNPFDIHHAKPQEDVFNDEVNKQVNNNHGDGIDDLLKEVDEARNFSMRGKIGEEGTFDDKKAHDDEMDKFLLHVDESNSNTEKTTSSTDYLGTNSTSHLDHVKDLYSDSNHTETFNPNSSFHDNEQDHFDADIYRPETLQLNSVEASEVYADYHGDCNTPQQNTYVDTDWGSCDTPQISRPNTDDISEQHVENNSEAKTIGDSKQECSEEFKPEVEPDLDCQMFVQCELAGDAEAEVDASTNDKQDEVEHNEEAAAASDDSDDLTNLLKKKSILKKQNRRKREKSKKRRKCKRRYYSSDDSDYSPEPRPKRKYVRRKPLEERKPRKKKEMPPGIKIFEGIEIPILPEEETNVDETEEVQPEEGIEIPEGVEVPEVTEGIVGVEVTLEEGVAPPAKVTPFCCPFCSKYFTTNKHMTSHIRIHTGETPYKCEECNKLFTRKEHHRDHMLRHRGETPYPCFMCGKKFIRRDKLIAHLKEHNIIIKCIRCNKSFPDSDALKNHIKLHEKKILNCELCPKTFHRKDKYQDHIRSHTGERPYVCTFCEKAFRRKYLLNEHIRVHTGETPYACQHCPEAFSKRDDYHKHMRIHTGELSYKCSLCQTAYTERAELKEHIREQHAGIKVKICMGESHNCEYCTKSFSKIRDLKNHQRIHTGDSPIQCTECAKTFTRREHLKNHMRTHTGDSPFNCDICKKAFSRKDKMVYHMKKYHGSTDNPYKCDFCSGTFSEEKFLEKHVKIHTGDTIPRCHFCFKNFKRNDDLRRHIRIHTGETPFKCEVCNKVFARKDHMMTHKKQKHSELVDFLPPARAKRPPQEPRPERPPRSHPTGEQFACRECGKLFVSSGQLSFHMRTHLGGFLKEKPFVCPVCSKRFRCKEDLLFHQQLGVYCNKDDDTQQRTEMGPNDSESSSNQQPETNKNFSSLYFNYLLSHQNNHLFAHQPVYHHPENRSNQPTPPTPSIHSESSNDTAVSTEHFLAQSTRTNPGVIQQHSSSRMTHNTHVRHQATTRMNNSHLPPHQSISNRINNPHIPPQHNNPDRITNAHIAQQLSNVDRIANAHILAHQQSNPNRTMLPHQQLNPNRMSNGPLFLQQQNNANRMNPNMLLPPHQTNSDRVRNNDLLTQQQNNLILFPPFPNYYSNDANSSNLLSL